MTDTATSQDDPTLNVSRWDRFFLRIARECAAMSKDPSTQVGSVIVRPNKTIVSTGWNGFARGHDDRPHLYEDRSFKIKTVVHAEINAILMARESLEGYTLYTVGLPPCPQCSSIIVQSGIRRVVTERREIPERWVEDIRLSITQMLRAALSVDFIDMDDGTLYQAYQHPKYAKNGIIMHPMRAMKFDEVI